MRLFQNIDLAPDLFEFDLPLCAVDENVVQIAVNSGGKDFWTGIYRSGRAATIISANSWKLREVALTWNLPARWMEKSKVFQSAAVSLVGRNLFYWVPDTNIWGDPDMWSGTGASNAPGVVANAMAGYRTFGFNINLTF